MPVPFGVKLVGLGSAVPKQFISNQDLEEFLDTSSEWIETRTGINSRHICIPGEEDGLSLSLTAARKALAGLDPTSLDLILVATSTPDFLYPSTACRLQHALGATKAVGMDLSAACSGFVFSLVTAAQFIQLGTYTKVLVVGVDIHSRFLDWTDRSVSILFGDAAGAVLLERCKAEENQLLGHAIHSDGSGACDLTLRTVGGLYPSGRISNQIETVSMNGRKIYQFAVKTVPESIQEAATAAGITKDQLDYVLCHQANQRILDALAERLEMPKERCLSNIAKYGNTSAASIPLVWDEYKDNLKDISLLAISGFGAGLTWGSLIWRWVKP
ncbi:MAG: beta-ketoacyl-ACP synthase III [Candidatus Caenarcaniphilales bacterium]|nr:beta-ketoacyl-ACP synthase III [Candidatus Caenarcaniphilales bacterium]